MMCFSNLQLAQKNVKTHASEVQDIMRLYKVIEEDENVIEIIDEFSFSDTLSEFSSYLSAPCSKVR